MRAADLDAEFHNSVLFAPALATIEPFAWPSA